MPPTSKRRLKGSVFIDLIKLLKHVQRTKGLPAMSASAAELLETRVLSSEWYSLEPFLELLDVTDAIMLKGDEARTVELGAAGGTELLRGPYRAYIQTSSAKDSVYAMRHAWRTHYDFAELSAEIESERTVQFTLSRYPDIRMTHALMVASWGLAAARLSGSLGANIEVLERPWKGGAAFRYRICIGK